MHLKTKGYECDRITHNELLSSAGTEYTGKLISGLYSLLWIATPSDWHIRTPTKKTTTHWQTVQRWLTKASMLGMLIVVFGPPGFLWKMPNIKETLTDLNLMQVRMRLCHFNWRFDLQNAKPSGSYLQFATTASVTTQQWQCNCGIPIQDHTLDWYGREEKRADWRRRIYSQCIEKICAILPQCVSHHESIHAIQDVAPSPLPITDEDEELLPTEARVRAKVRLKSMKEAGIKPNKKIKYIEPGNDDCGEDLSGLGSDIFALSCDVILENVDSSDDDDFHIAVPIQINDSETKFHSITTYLCFGTCDAVDILEICGGEEARISQVGFKRGLSSGGNIDLTTECDLNNPATRDAVLRYLTKCYVMVAILQPNCRTTGSFSHYNALMYHDTWHKHHLQDLPHLKFCATVALFQINAGRYFLREQPAGTSLDCIAPWNQVIARESVESLLVDQCMAGAKDDTGMPAQKKTEWMANHRTLLARMTKLKCDGKHQHGNPTGKALNKLKVYPWKMCKLIVEGIEDLKTIDPSWKTWYTNKNPLFEEKAWTRADVFPTVGSDSTDLPVLPAKGMGCPACHSSLRALSPMHTRKPTTCKYPDIAAKPYLCPSCADAESKYRNPRFTDSGHTYKENQCRFVDKSALVRTGAHPRDPRQMTVVHPSSDVSGYDAANIGGSSSSHEGQPPLVEPAHGDVPQGDVPTRTRRTYSSSGTGESRLPDWSRFNVQISLRNLRSYEPSVVQKELRMLHLRWWHASSAKMRTILQAAGVDEARLAFIKPIVDTCRECRAWQKRGNVIMPSLDITTSFNEKGECDLMFYKRKIGFHCIDRAIRLSSGCELSDKLEASLLDAYHTSWVAHHGPFKILYSDGEGGLTTATAIAHLKRLGTELSIRAPDQHARLAEVRQSMLRHTMHMIEQDLLRHGDEIPFKRLYAEALFVVNAFSFYNGVSPYNALTGRQPAFLPDLENIDFTQGGENTSGDRERRIREASIQAITQSTAVAKINRARNTRTTLDGRKIFTPGQLMDYHRPTASKDEHGGWNGPFPVVRNIPDRGIVVCNNAGREILVRYPDARLTLFIEVLMTLETGLDNDATDTVLDTISRLSPGKQPIYHGYVVTPGTCDNAPRFQLSSASKKAPKVYLALQYLIRNYFRISDVFAVRIGNGVSKVSKCEYADKCTLIYYTSDIDPNFHYYESNDTAIDFKTITHSQSIRFMQCLIKSGCPHTIEDNSSISRELSSSSTPPDDHRGNEDDADAPSTDEPLEPLTPVDIDVEGDLPTIHEDNEEHDTDEFILENFYAELMSDKVLLQETDEQVSHGNVHLYPVHMMPENTVVFTVTNDGGDSDEYQHEYVHDVMLDVNVHAEDNISLESDEIGTYVEICFTTDMAPVVLSETQYSNISDQDIATIRVYVSANTKRAVVVKEDDLLSKPEFIKHAREIAIATITEIKTWLTNSCFKLCQLKNAQNVMTSRYVAKWKWIKNDDGTWKKVIRMRLVLRGFMDIEAFSIDTFSGTAKRSSQRVLASEKACHPSWILASLDIDKAFLKGFTYKELADATGEKERTVCFRLPPGSAAHLRKFPGFENYDESIHCLQCVKPGTGTKDAPRAFSLKLRKTTQNIGLKPTAFDPEFEVMKDLITAKHVDDVNMAGTERQIDMYTKEVEKIFGKCKLNKRQFTNCGVQHTCLDDLDVILDQDVYITTMRPIVHSELTGTSPDKEATKSIADLFVSLRGALAYTTLTQAWIQVYIVALQRVQQPTNLDVRRLNAITRKLQKEPQKLIFKAMVCQKSVDLHTDSGYRRMEKVDDEKGYGMRGLCLLRRGICYKTKKPVVHLLDSVCKSHRLTIRSSYSAEMLAASHGYDDAYPTLITLVELANGVMRPEQIKHFREYGGLSLKVMLTTDAESVYKSLTSRDLKTPTEKTLLGHVSWIRELLQLKLIESMQWCDTRDMTADGHTKGCIDRQLLLEVMRGEQSYRHDVKRHTPHRGEEK